MRSVMTGGKVTGDLTATDWIVTGLVVLLLGGALSATVLVVTRRLGRILLRREMRTLAQRLGATLAEVSAHGACLTWSRAETEVELRLAGGAWRLRASFATEERLRIGFRSPAARALPGPGALALADTVFDHRFLVRGGSEAFARRALGAPARTAIHAIADLVPPLPFPTPAGELQIELGPNGLDLNLPRGCAVAEIADHAMALHAALRDALGRSVPVLTAHRAIESGRCPVCGDPIGSAPRACPTCSTGHHPECWDYFGGCAIYACESRGTAPGSAPAKKG